MMLFKETISDWDSWSHVYASIGAFAPLIARICELHGIEAVPPQGLTPGTNAVFRVGSAVVKIFAPDETGIDAKSDFNTERFGLMHANANGVAAPRLLAEGVIEDKYRFYYLVMEFLEQPELDKIKSGLTDAEKEGIGRQLREIIDALRSPCGRFNNTDVIAYAVEDKEGWEDFPESFQKERHEWLRAYTPDSLAFTHGDLNADNMLYGDGELFIIDFADALLAPREYEDALLVCSPFGFEPPYLRGYFGDYDAAGLTDMCLRGILMHGYGDEIIRCHIAPREEINSIAMLRERIYSRFRG